MQRVVMIVCLVLLSTTQAFAHEPREVGPYTVTVGWRVEPAFEDEPNAVDILISRTADEKPISVRDGDVVELSVEIQLRADDALDAEVIQAAPLEPAPSQTFGFDNRYNTWLRPTHDGAYGFRITGMISDASDPQAGPLMIDETYICRGGSQNAEGRSFACIEDPPAFPGGPMDATGQDVESHRDNDEYSLQEDNVTP